MEVTEPKEPSQILAVLSLITGAVAPLVTLVYLLVSRDPFVLGAALCSTVIFSSATIAIIGLSKAYEIRNSSLRFCVLAILTVNSVMLLFVLATQLIGISTMLFKQ